MGRSQESFNKKDVRNKKEKKRKEKEKKRLARKEDKVKGGSLDDMIAYVDENGMISDTPPDPSNKKDIKLEDIEISIRKQEDKEVLDPIRKGVVSFFNDSKGYGFIKDMNTQESFFVHINNVIDEIKEGNLVNFEIGKGMKGPIAMQVKLFKEPKPVVKEPKPVVKEPEAEVKETPEPTEEKPGPEDEKPKAVS